MKGKRRVSLRTRLQILRGLWQNQAITSAGAASGSYFCSPRGGVCFFWQASCLHELNIQRDCYFLTDENSAGFEHGVVGKAKVLAVDLCGCGNRNPGVSPRIFRWRSWAFHCKSHASGDAVNCEIAFD